MTYDPKDYIKDYSWIGDIGKTIAVTAHQFPAMIAMNKKVKQNRFFKEETYQNTQATIDKLANSPDQEDRQILANIASSMGIAAPNGVAGDLTPVAAEIKKRIPQKTNDEETNETYAKRFMDTFAQPIVQASQKSGYSVGKLMARFTNSSIQQAANANPLISEEYKKKSQLDQQQAEFDQQKKQKQEQNKPAFDIASTVLGQYNDKEITPDDEIKIHKQALQLATAKGMDKDQFGTITGIVDQQIQDAKNKVAAQRQKTEDELKTKESEARISNLNTDNARQQAAADEAKDPHLAPNVTPEMIEKAQARYTDALKELRSVDAPPKKGTAKAGLLAHEELVSNARVAARKAKEQLDLLTGATPKFNQTEGRASDFRSAINSTQQDMSDKKVEEYVNYLNSVQLTDSDSDQAILQKLTNDLRNRGFDLAVDPRTKKYIAIPTNKPQQSNIPVGSARMQQSQSATPADSVVTSTGNRFTITQE
jgi:hypothetical protein